MASMSYCRFENTYHDFKECVYDLQDQKVLSPTERNYSRCMYELAKEYIDAFEVYSSREEKEF